MRAPEQIAEALKGIVLLLLGGIRALKERVLMVRGMRALNGIIVRLLLEGIIAHLKLMATAAALALGMTTALLMVMKTMTMITAVPQEGVNPLNLCTLGFCSETCDATPYCSVFWCCKT